jgi:hypothetical protein
VQLVALCVSLLLARCAARFAVVAGKAASPAAAIPHIAPIATRGPPLTRRRRAPTATSPASVATNIFLRTARQRCLTHRSRSRRLGPQDCGTPALKSPNQDHAEVTLDLRHRSLTPRGEAIMSSGAWARRCHREHRGQWAGSIVQGDCRLIELAGLPSGSHTDALMRRASW